MPLKRTYESHTRPMVAARIHTSEKPFTLVATPQYSHVTTIVTHNGTFHADDVFACAVLLLVLEHTNVEIIRTRDKKIIESADYVVDVGGELDLARNRFDHHQRGGAGGRENGVPYASFGLVWKKFGPELSGSQKVADEIDRKLVQTIDAMDNGVDIFSSDVRVYRYLIHDLVFSFKPSWKEKYRSYDEAFAEVLELAKKLLEREIILARHLEEGKALVLEAYYRTQDKRLIVLDEEDYPWQEVFLDYPEVLYVVTPTDGSSGNWKVKAVRDSILGFANRKDLPAEWAGLEGKELQAVTGVPDARFCHNKLFIAIAGSKEGALKLAQLALEAVPQPPTVSQAYSS